MSTQLGYASHITNGNDNDLYYPLINKAAIPYAYEVDLRPQKRVRLTTDGLSAIKTTNRLSLPQEDNRSAQSLNGAFHANVTEATTIAQGTEQRSASVPPRGRRVTKRLPRSKDVLFVQESFSFPEQQTWLKPKPRQRRAAVEAVKDIPRPSSQAPDQGEALSLDKHADRIAALIAQKRRDNESKMFRERMSVQQRLHRGEQDSNDRMIAASHDELKRKMELSARGIFEECPPDGKEPEFASSEAVTIVAPTTQASESQPATPQNIVPDTALAAVPANDERDSSGSVAPNTDEDESDVDEEFVLAPSFDEPISQPRGVSIPAHTSDIQQSTAAAGFWETHTSVTAQTYSVSTASAYPQATQLYLSQPRFSNHRYNNPHIMQQDQYVVPQQQWAAQMWQALPSTATPVVQARTVVQSMHTPQPERPVLQHPQPQPLTTQFAAANRSDIFHTPSTTPDQAGLGIVFNPYANSNEPAPATEEAQQQPPTLQSGLNMFTRQARENGVIGGNNNYVEPAGGEGRRNMFASRS